MRARELKRLCMRPHLPTRLSRPMRARELKQHDAARQEARPQSRPIWARELKHAHEDAVADLRVASSRARELKRTAVSDIRLAAEVAPHAGA